MRNLITIAFLLLAMSFSFAGNRGTIDIGGTPCLTDTLEQYQVGPGTWYTRMNICIGTRTVGLYLMEVDLSNPYATLETRNGGGSVGQNEPMVTAHQLLDSAGHRPIGAINCNFFWQPHTTLEGLQWQPTGGTAHNGILITQPDDWTMSAQWRDDPRWRDMGYMALDFGKRVWMEQLLWDGRITLADSSSYQLRDCNRYRTNPGSDEIAFFNEGLGTHPTRVIDTGSEIVFSVDEWRINRTIRCTMLSRNNLGSTLIGPKQGVLQARGTGDAFLSQLQPGDTFQINLGIYAPHIGNARPDIREMAMGNALCMVDSQLIIRNWNEDYNTQVYPRTGIATNTAGNRFWMLVMEKPGMSTEEMCHVFRAAGASYAAGCDGGGSAEMEIFGHIMNTTTEGTPRAINTMIFAMSTAPDNDTIAEIRFRDFSRSSLPAFSSYTPVFRTYNRFGTLLSDDYRDCTLSCSPATLGSISADGRTFIAGDQAATGTLTAHVGNITVSRTITVEAGQLRLALDSILIDDRSYTIETQSVTAGATYAVAPSQFVWTVADSSICSVNEEGLLRGIANGETTVTGALAGREVSMHVRVEIADSPVLTATDFLNADTAFWTLKNSSKPIWWGEQNGVATLCFSLSSARNPQISLTGDWLLYSLPDSIELLVNSPVTIKSVGLLGNTNCSSTQLSVSLTPEMSIGTTASYKAALADFGFPTEEIASWPFHLKKIVLTLTDVQTGIPYAVRMEGLRLIYSHFAVTAADRIPAPKYGQKIIRDGQMIILRDGRSYDLLGREIQ